MTKNTKGFNDFLKKKKSKDDLDIKPLAPSVLVKEMRNGSLPGVSTMNTMGHINPINKQEDDMKKRNKLSVGFPKPRNSLLHYLNFRNAAENEELSGEEMSDDEMAEMDDDEDIDMDAEEYSDEEDMDNDITDDQMDPEFEMDSENDDIDMEPDMEWDNPENPDLLNYVDGELNPDASDYDAEDEDFAGDLTNQELNFDDEDENFDSNTRPTQELDQDYDDGEMNDEDPEDDLDWNFDDEGEEDPMDDDDMDDSNGFEFGDDEDDFEEEQETSRDYSSFSNYMGGEENEEDDYADEEMSDDDGQDWSPEEEDDFGQDEQNDFESDDEFQGAADSMMSKISDEEIEQIDQQTGEVAKWWREQVVKKPEEPSEDGFEEEAEESIGGDEQHFTAQQDAEGNAIDKARVLFQQMINQPDSDEGNARDAIIAAFEQQIGVSNSTATSYYQRLAKEAGLTNQGDGAGGAEDEVGDEEGPIDGLPIDTENEFADEMDDEDSNDPDARGIIRQVDNAHLVYKKQSEDGTFEELWNFNVGRDVKDELKIRRDILAGTDIPQNHTRSEDGSQSYTVSTMGNAQLLHIVGLSN